MTPASPTQFNWTHPPHPQPTTENFIAKSNETIFGYFCPSFACVAGTRLRFLLGLLASLPPHRPDILFFPLCILAFYGRGTQRTVTQRIPTPTQSQSQSQSQLPLPLSLSPIPPLLLQLRFPFVCTLPSVYLHCISKYCTTTIPLDTIPILFPHPFRILYRSVRTVRTRLTHRDYNVTHLFCVCVPTNQPTNQTNSLSLSFRSRRPSSPRTHTYTIHTSYQPLSVPFHSIRYIYHIISYNTIQTQQPIKYYLRSCSYSTLQS